jgi:SAM-dependent methyltransferase
VPTSGDPRRAAEVASTRAFFGPRATSWDDRFPNDEPIFAEAIAELAPPAGGVVLDVACGTGRALPLLRAAVGPTGRVLGIDITVEMLEEAGRRRRSSAATLVLADAIRLPLADRSCDSVFAAGLLPHLRDPFEGLSELARVCRPGARLALFHPIGRAVLAARHGHELDPHDIRSEARIRAALTQTCWRCELVDDADERYLALAVRAG